MIPISEDPVDAEIDKAMEDIVNEGAEGDLD